MKPALDPPTLDFDRNRRARRPFDEIASQYDMFPEIMSFPRRGVRERRTP